MRAELGRFFNREVFIQALPPLSIQNLIMADLWLDLMMELLNNLGQS